MSQSESDDSFNHLLNTYFKYNSARDQLSLFEQEFAQACKSFGTTPEKFEAGLQNYAGMIGSGAAAKFISKVGKDKIARQETMLNKYITEEFSKIDKIKILGPQDYKERGGIVSFNVQGMDPHDVALVLDEMNNIFINSVNYVNDNITIGKIHTKADQEYILHFCCPLVPKTKTNKSSSMFDSHDKKIYLKTGEGNGKRSALSKRKLIQHFKECYTMILLI